MPKWIALKTLVQQVAYAKLRIDDRQQTNEQVDKARIAEAKRRIRHFLSKKRNSQLTRGLRISQDEWSGKVELISFEFWMEPDLNWLDCSAWLQVRLQESPTYLMQPTNNLLGYGDIEVSSDVGARIPPVAKGWQPKADVKVRDHQRALNEYTIELIRAQGSNADTRQARIAELMAQDPNEWKRRFSTPCPARSSIATRLSEAAKLEGGWQCLVSKALANN